MDNYTIKKVNIIFMLIIFIVFISLEAYAADPIVQKLLLGDVSDVEQKSLFGLDSEEIKLIVVETQDVESEIVSLSELRKKTYFDFIEVLVLVATVFGVFAYLRIKGDRKKKIQI